MNPEKPPRRTAVLSAGAFAALLALAACGGSASPEGAVENFLDNGVEDFSSAVYEGDFDAAADIADEHFCAEDVAALKGLAAAYAGMSSDEIAEAIAASNEDPSLSEDRSYEIGEVTEDDDTATVEVAMTEDGETTDETFELVKEGDAWKICGRVA